MGENKIQSKQLAIVLSLFGAPASAEMSKDPIDRALEMLAGCKEYGSIERPLDIRGKDLSFSTARFDAIWDENGGRFSRDCGDNCNGILVSVNNTTSQPAVMVRVKGVQSGKVWEGHTVHSDTGRKPTSIDPGTKGEFWVYIGGPIKDISLYVDVFTTSKSECLVKKTEEDYAREEREAAEESARREKEAEVQAIYENCVVSKSEGNASAITEIRSMCDRISKTPSWMQKLRWGN